MRRHSTSLHRSLSRRAFLGSAAAGLVLGPSVARGQQNESILITDGRIHTMDAANTVVDRVLIRNGRFAAVGASAVDPAARVIDLGGRTVIPGIIDAHNHIVLVGNRPGWHTPLEHVFTIPDAVAALEARAGNVPPGDFITTVGPVAAMQFAEQRLPSPAELDAVGRPVYILAAQGGAVANRLAREWLEPRGVAFEADGSFAGRSAGTALQVLRQELLTPETRRRGAREALEYYAMLGITTHRDLGAFHSEEPATGVASENTYTMHNPFLELDRDGTLPTRLRIDFLHQDPPDADPPIPTLSDRLRNSFPFFGNDWLRTGGIGEFTGGGLDGLRAIARAGWRAEDHALNLAGATGLIEARETVHAETPINDLRWILSHIPAFPPELADRAHAMGMGVLVGWGPTRRGSDVGPPYRMLVDHPIPVGYHSDGGDITVINPWMNLATITTGQNLAGEAILGDQTLSRQETLWLATRANKWFIREDDLGSIEVGNHADLAVLDRDFFEVPAAEIARIRSVLTMVGGKVAYDGGEL